MRHLPSLLLLLVLGSGCRTAEPLASDAPWESLFDGESLRGWRGFRRDHAPAGWQAVDGAIRRVGGGGDLVTEDQFGDFVLELEWQVAEGGNSGLFFRVSEEEDAVWRTGPEMQILDDANHPDGADPRTSAGSNYALHAPREDVALGPGEWNRVRLEVRGPRVRHWLNGVLVVEYELWSEDWEKLVAASKFGAMPGYGRRSRGHIALQDHGDPVAFRNLRVQRLD